MPNTLSRIEPETIDLTAEDSESEDLTSSIFASRATSEEAPALQDEPFQPQHTRAPPFLPAQATNQEIIDLDADYLGELGGDVQETQGSPDLVITGAREVHNDLPGANPQRRLPTPPVLRFRFGGEGGITQYLRRGREAILGRPTAARPEALADVANDYPRFPAWPFPQPNGPAAHRLVVTNHEPDQFNVNLDDYEQVHLNYHEAAFDFGNGRGRVEVRFGNRESSQPEAVEQEPYKEPSPPGPGYSRNLVEDDVAVCPSCNDELAIGGDDTKQQIWISKACGHVSSTARVLGDLGTDERYRSIAEAVLSTSRPKIRPPKVANVRSNRKWPTSSRTAWRRVAMRS